MPQSLSRKILFSCNFGYEYRDATVVNHLIWRLGRKGTILGNNYNLNYLFSTKAFDGSNGALLFEWPVFDCMYINSAHKSNWECGYICQNAKKIQYTNNNIFPILGTYLSVDAATYMPWMWGKLCTSNKSVLERNDLDWRPISLDILVSHLDMKLVGKYMPLSMRKCLN